MGDPRNKIRKLQEAEADQRRMAALAADYGPPTPLPTRSPTVRCEGCGIDGQEHWRSGGTFVRLFFVSGDHWDPGKVYCEHCLEPLTGIKPDATP